MAGGKIKRGEHKETRPDGTTVDKKAEVEQQIQEVVAEVLDRDKMVEDVKTIDAQVAQLQGGFQKLQQQANQMSKAFDRYQGARAYLVMKLGYDPAAPKADAPEPEPEKKEEASGDAQPSA